MPKGNEWSIVCSQPAGIGPCMKKTSSRLHRLACLDAISKTGVMQAVLPAPIEGPCAWARFEGPGFSTEIVR
jgi:hypothetical protein